MKNYNDYINYSKKIYDIHMSMSVLNWDMETHMPKNGNKFRAQQLSTLAKIAYELETNFKYGKLKFIGRDLHTFVLPGKYAFPKDTFFIYFPNKLS